MVHCFDAVTDLFSVLQDQEILTEACYLLTCISELPNSRIAELVDNGVMAGIVTLLNHPKIEVVESALQIIGKMLLITSNDSNFYSVVAAAASSLVALFEKSSTKIVKLATGIVLNIMAEGTFEQRNAFVSADAVPGLISLLSSTHPSVASRAVFALGKIATVLPPQLRDHIMEQGIIERLLVLIKSDASVRFTCSALVSNFFLQDKTILGCACFVLGRISFKLKDRIQEMVDYGVVPLIVPLLDHPEIGVVKYALETITNISDYQTDSLVAAGACPLLVKLFENSDTDIVRMAEWTVSRIAENFEQIKDVFSAGAVPRLISLLGSQHPRVAELALSTLFSLADDGSELRDHLIEQGIIEPLLALIKPDAPVILNCCTLRCCYAVTDFYFLSYYRLRP